MAKFKPPSPEFIAARNKGGRQTPKAIVLHGTVSSDNAGTARNIALWWNGPGSPMSSCHYVVDPKEVIQTVGDHTVAYHCGYNQDSVGVEFCDEQTGPASRWQDEDSMAILRRAARLVAELCLAYNIKVKRPSVLELRQKGPHGIYAHNDSRLAFGGTTHTDPRDFPWKQFLGMVRAEVKALRKGSGKTFKVLHAPLHGGSATNKELQSALKRKGVIAVAYSEAYRHGKYLGRRPLWNAVMGSGTDKDARGRAVQRDVTILVRRRFKMLARKIVKASDASTPLRIAPERYLAYSVNDVYGRKTAFIGLHPHAAVMDAWDSDRAGKYRDSMRVLADTVNALREAHDQIDIVVMGDFNYRDLGDGRFWAPSEVSRRLGLDYVNRGLDWVMFSKGLHQVGKATIVSAEENGQDHPWIEVELRQI